MPGRLYSKPLRALGRLAAGQTRPAPRRCWLSLTSTRAGYLDNLTNLDAAVTTRLAPTTAGRTLDVSTGGEAGIDWANVGSPTTTLNLSGTTVGTANTVGSTGLTAIADAAWDEALSGHSTSGTAGAALSAASAAGDPWATALPGSYTSGQAGYIVGNLLSSVWNGLTSAITTSGSIGKLIIDKLGLVTSTTEIQTNGLVSTGSVFTIFQGETINATSANRITLLVPTGTIDLTGFTPKFGITKVTANSGTSTLAVTGTVINAGAAGQGIVFSLTSAQTAALALSTGSILAGGMYSNPALVYAYRWEMSATDGSSNCPTLGTGYVDVKARGTSC